MNAAHPIGTLCVCVCVCVCVCPCARACVCGVCVYSVIVLATPSLEEHKDMYQCITAIYWPFRFILDERWVVGGWR